MAGGAETILFQILVIVLGAKIGGELASRARQPPVVGEILVGILLGPSLLGLIPPFEILDSVQQFFADPTGPVPSAPDLETAQGLRVLALLAELGVLILLFEVGLESSLGELRKVGASAGLVGTYGVVFSLAIGFIASEAFATQFGWVVTENAQRSPHLLHVFVGAILTATSVGITARVLGDMGKIRTKEAQIVLGAAVLDDVLGLIVLAIVGGLVVDPAGLSALGVGLVFVKSLGFFVLAIVLGIWLAPRLLDFVHRTFKATQYVHLGAAFVFMLFVSYLATLVGLAAIVGAFAGGLALTTSAHRHVIFEHLKPVGSLFVSFFFVVLGARVDLRQIAGETAPLVLLVAAILSVAGILGKLMAGWGVVRVRASRYVVGVGMVPRGEVGLIFALFGLEHGLLANWQYTGVILVVLVTTLIAPFWLKALAPRFSALVEPEAPGQARLGDAVQH